MRRDMPPELRFLMYTEVTENCWNWLGWTQPNGYGTITRGNGIPGHNLVHRVAYECSRGQIPPTLQIDHLCRNRACVNPDHMELVTLKENVLRGVGITAVNKAKSECKDGHPFDTQNTYVRKTGARACRKCAMLSGRAKRGWLGQTNNRDKTHCKSGHQFTKENTYNRSDGGRSCRICSSASKRAYKIRNRKLS